MRIRLNIRRHELPAVKILFAVPEGPTSISKVVELVNDLIPLEAEDWGLEDYVVSVGDYECLHYMDAHAILNVNDEVQIRAIQSSDIRTRRVSSRYQVSSAGAHLIDGIAYGRSYLKRPNRPAVRIPPLKRRRLLYDEPEEDWSDSLGADVETEFTPGRLRIMSSFEDADGDGEAETETEGPECEVEDDSTIKPAGCLRSGTRRSSSTVRFEGLDQAMGADDDDDDSDEEDYEPEDSSLSSDDESEGSELDSAEPQAHDIKEQHVSSRKRNRTTLPSASTNQASNPSLSSSSSASSDAEGDSSSSSGSSGSEGDNDEEQDSNTLSIVDVDRDARTSAVEGAQDTPVTDIGRPFQGSSATRARNQRRRDARKRAKESQEDIPHVKNTPEGVVDGIESSISQGGSNSQRVHTRFGDDGEGDSCQMDGASQSDTPNILASQAQQNCGEEPPEVMSARPQSSSINDGFPQSSATVDIGAVATEAIRGANEGATSSGATSRRTKLDLSSSRRLVFGSLGVRAPRNKAEESKLQAKLSQTKPKTAPKEAPAQLPARVFTGDEWKEKIILSAEECYDEDVVLSTPPFPFVQRWDPQQKRGKKRKRAARGYYGVEDDAVPADDEAAAPVFDDVEEGAEEQAYEDIDAYDEEKEDDFPPLPADINTLPALEKSQCQPGAIIAFKQLEVSQATNWAPAMSEYKTARIDAHDLSTGAMELTLAYRDVRSQELEYDEDGNRLYGKFEMPQDDNEDPARIDASYDEMVDPRILVDAGPGGSPRAWSNDATGQSPRDTTTTLVPDSLREADIHVAQDESQARLLLDPSTNKAAKVSSSMSGEGSQQLSVSSAANGLDQAAQLPASLVSSSTSYEAVQKETQGREEAPFEPSLMQAGTLVVEATAG